MNAPNDDKNANRDSVVFDLTEEMWEAGWPFTDAGHRWEQARLLVQRAILSDFVDEFGLLSGAAREPGEECIHMGPHGFAFQTAHYLPGGIRGRWVVFAEYQSEKRPAAINLTEEQAINYLMTGVAS